MKKSSHKKRFSQFAFKLNEFQSQSKPEEEQNNNDQLEQMLLLNGNLTEQQLLAFIKNQENDQANSPKKSHISINKDQQEKITQFFQRYEPIYFNKNLIREMCFKFKQGVFIIKYKEGFYFGEVVESLDQQNVSKKIKQGKGIFVYSLLEKSIQQNKRIYEGQWLNDQRNGLGFQKFADGSVYHGNYYDNKPGGRGKLTNSHGQIYEGQWKDGIKQGKGFWQGVHGQTFMGEWVNGKPHGYGLFVNHNGDRYEGELRNGLKHGEGIQKFINGDIYKGLFQNNQPHGYGEYFWKNKSYFKGNFSNGLRSGHGIWKKGAGNQDNYEGQYQNDKKWGYGVFTWANGNVFKGSYEADLRNGYGDMFWADGSYYKGNWKNGIQHGKGELFVMRQGLRVGQFQNNQIVTIQYEQPWEDQSKEEVNQAVPQIKQDKKLLKNHSKASNTSLKSKNSILSRFTKHRTPFDIRSSLQPIKTKPSELSFTLPRNQERNKIHSQASTGMRSVPLKNLHKDNQSFRYFSKATFFKPDAAFPVTEKSINIQKSNYPLDDSRVSNNQITQQRKNRILHSSFYLRKFKKVKSSQKQQLISWK